MQPWRRLFFCDRELLSCTSRFFSTGLSQSKGVKKCGQISSHGRCCDSRGFVSVGTCHPSGYYVVSIRDQQFLVHRLVAFAFLGPPPNPQMWQIHHKDGNPANNHLKNLEYATPSQNLFARLPSFKSFHGLSKPVMWRAFGSQDWRTSASVAAAATETGVSSRSVLRSCSRKNTIKGFEFRLADDERTGEVWRQMLDPKTGLAVPGRLISSTGRLQFPNGRISAGYQRRDGYCSTSLYSRLEYVHRLVAFAFLGPPPTLQHTQINHRDHDKGNNAVENLEYTTASENVQHSYVRSRRPTSKVKPVESRLNGSHDSWIWYSSVRSAARACGVNPGSASRWAHNGNSTGKFEFRFAQEPAMQTRPGEEWRDVDVAAHLDERYERLQMRTVWIPIAFLGMP